VFAGDVPTPRSSLMHHFHSSRVPRDARHG